MISDLLSGFGVDLGTLKHSAGPDYPKPVPGRVAHIDADFMAYQVAAESKEELSGEKPRKSLDDMFHNARVAAEHVMRLAGATSYVCHTTPSCSTKGGRAEQAVQKEYQANRKGREKPEFLDTVRAFIGRELNGIPHMDQEADDGLAQAAYNDTNACICSKDKDLRMVPGLHLDMYTGEMVRVDPTSFGHIELTDKGKLVGYGPKFFFAQCLMGDAADNIAGAPGIPGRVRAEVAPTAAYIKAVENGSDKQIDAELAKTIKCGPTTAFKVLDHTTSIREAFALVKRCFTELAEHHGHEFKHWKTGAVVSPTQALLGDMQCLWMRRNKNPMDVVEWLKTS